MDILVLPYLPIYGGRHPDETKIINCLEGLGYNLHFPYHPVTAPKVEELKRYNVSIDQIEPSEVYKMDLVLGFLMKDLFLEGYEPYLDRALQVRSYWYTIHPDWILMNNEVWQYPKHKPIQPFYQRRMSKGFPEIPYLIWDLDRLLPSVLTYMSKILSHPIFFNSNFSRELALETVTDPEFSKLFESYGISPPKQIATDKWRTIYLPVLEVDEEPPLLTDGTTKTIIYPSRLGYDKSADVILKLLSHILDLRNDVRIVLTRSPNPNNEWENESIVQMYNHFMKKGNGRIILPKNGGWFPTNDYKQYTTLADIAVFGGPHETFGRAVGDASQRQTAVIAPNISVFPELWGEGAILVDFSPSMESEMKNAIIHLLENPKELEHRKVMMREVSRYFTTQNFVTNLIEEIENT